jgi:hypothetical protein
MESNQKSTPLNSTSEEAKRSGRSTPLNKASPPHGVHLEPLSEDDIVPEFEVDGASIRSSTGDGYLGTDGENRGLTRSTSSMQMRDLKDQMHDLKGRLSVLRDRARDDTMKRRSLQSLRTPSPFTAAEQWYTAANAYTAPVLSADAGVGHSPRKEQGEFESLGMKAEESEESMRMAEEEQKNVLPEYARSEATSVYEDVSEGHHATDGLPSTREPQIVEDDEKYNTATEDDQEEIYGDQEYNDEIVNRDELDDYESDSSLYHDTQTISHEDREDAFDYEHFFLHSAMGTISQQRRRDSFSSEDSVETTRGPPATNSQESQKADPRTSLGHFRSESTDSVSTMATFATATEGLEDDSEGDNYAVQQLDAPMPRSTTPETAKRATFGFPVGNGGSADQQPNGDEDTRPKTAVHNPTERSIANRPSVASFDSFESVGTTRSFPLINKPKSQLSLQNQLPARSASQQNGSLSDLSTSSDGRSGERHQSSPVHMLAREDQILVERLVASLGNCVLGLQESSRGSFEGRLWRRRLDAARRILEGEEEAI